MAVARNAAGRLKVFACSGDRALNRTRQTAPKGARSEWAGRDRRNGFAETMHDFAGEPSSMILERKVVHDWSIAAIFGVPFTLPFLKLVRVRRDNGMALSRETAWYNITAVPALREADLSVPVEVELAACGAAAL
jgi:GntR family transcriptional regulator